MHGIYCEGSQKGPTVMVGAGRIDVVHDALSAEIQVVLAALYASMDQGMSRICVGISFNSFSRSSQVLFL